MSSVTPLGISIALRPMRDMKSPDLAEDLAADAALARLAVGHQPLRRGEDGDAEAIADLRHVLGRDVLALAGTRHPAEAGDRAPGAPVVPEGHGQRALVVVGLARDHAVDEALLTEDLGDADLQVRTRALDALLARAD